MAPGVNGEGSSVVHQFELMHYRGAPTPDGHENSPGLAACVSVVANPGALPSELVSLTPRPAMSVPRHRGLR